MAKKKTKPTDTLQSWLDDIKAYEREFKRWENRVQKILHRYKDDKRGTAENDRAKFNILWSNVQTLSAATFSKLPKPDVSRRFRDNDPVGRVASLILERALDYHIQHYSEYRMALRADVLDRFLGGRGVAWVRYQPHFKAAQEGTPVSGSEITDDADEGQEELDYECASVDYVHWKDFGHSVARTWEEVNRVWRVVYMTEDALRERFGDEVAKTVPMDASPKEITGQDGFASKIGDAVKRAAIFEGWDKAEKKAYWFSKSSKGFLDVRDDPLELEEFFPCPRPLFSTLTNDSLVPVPDFTLYQDQANELDVLADRKDGLIKALQVKGVYDASAGVEIARIFTEGENNSLLPVKNWAAFAEKNGLQGAINLVDIKPIAEALVRVIETERSVKEDVYEITGISDIVRGQTQASETATAQQIKGQYASLRLRAYQEQVAQFATELLQLMAQIICAKFSPETILAISAADQLSEQDKQLIQPALELLIGPERMADPAAEPGPNPLRSFRVEVNADTLVYLDEQAEKEARVEFLTATGTFLQQMTEVLMATPPEAKGPVVGLLMEMLKYGVTGFKVGKNIEGAFDETADRLKQLANQPPPPPQEPPEVQVEKIKAQMEDQKSQREDAREREKMQAELQFKAAEHAQNMQFEREKHAQTMEQQSQHFQAQLQAKSAIDHASLQSKHEIEKDKVAAAQKPTTNVQVDGNKEIAKMAEMVGGAMQAVAESQERIAEMMGQFKETAEKLAKPRKVIRGSDGLVAGVE